jgi:hypothetical protein
MKHVLLLALPLLLLSASCTAPHAHHRGRHVVKKAHKHGPGFGHHLRGGVWVRL